MFVNMAVFLSGWCITEAILLRASPLESLRRQGHGHLQYANHNHMSVMHGTNLSQDILVFLHIHKQTHTQLCSWFVVVLHKCFDTLQNVANMFG